MLKKKEIPFTGKGACCTFKKSKLLFKSKNQEKAQKSTKIYNFFDFVLGKCQKSSKYPKSGEK